MKMKTLLTLLSIVSLGMAAQAQETKPAEKKAPNPVLSPIQDIPGLPRVLIIGDSISMGYTAPVRKLLHGKANVHRIGVNGGPTKNGIKNIDAWLGDKKWDVIHFNWGIHDLKIMEDGKRQVEPADYEKNLRELVTKMKATGAKLIWATTTPIPNGKMVPDRKFGQVDEYNAIAAKVMTEMGVPTDDLNGYITPEFTKLQVPNDLHYKKEGSDFLAKKVAEEIEKALPKK
jgi:lysophospholipase L1-like esterase